MKTVSYIISISLVIILFTVCKKKSMKKLDAKVYFTSSDLNSSRSERKVDSLGNAIMTPISFSGKLLRMDFHSDYCTKHDNYSPPDVWHLRIPDGDNEEEQMNNEGPVDFDLTQKIDISGDLTSNIGLTEKL